MDDDGFSDFVRARTPALLRSAYLLTGDRQLAEDLVQSALLATSRRWSRVLRKDAPEVYVRRVMYHQQVAWWRRRRAPELLVDQVAEPKPAGSAGDEVASRLDLAAALGTLPERQRACVVLRYYDDLTEVEAAQVLGVTVGTVKSQTHKALRRLRVLLGDAGVVGEDMVRDSDPGLRSVGGAR